ncbi:actin polymerization protein [Zalerion maritima]|uniref:Actin polymerization protein n=1 Tax=Zalerion maritima TaxID=339359 RepID=A0AAD5RTQ8_9PEZI|nr:actin polymerization protein [Zalerion maritima]
MLIMTNAAAEMVEGGRSSASVGGPAPTNTTASSSAVMSPITSPVLSASNSPAPASISKSEPQSVLVRRQFPAVTFILMYTSPDSIPSIQGVFMSLSNANQECRRLRSLDAPLSQPETSAELEARVKEERKRDIGRELERWHNAEGVECWVEVHEVTPRKWVDRASVSSVTHPPQPKLYQNEEDDDEILEDEDEIAGHGLST